jgi:hypothetical protein
MFVGLFNPFIHLFEWFSSNWIKSDQVGSNWFKLVQIGSKNIKMDQVDGLVQIKSSWINLVQDKSD